MAFQYETRDMVDSSDAVVLSGVSGTRTATDPRTEGTERLIHVNAAPLFALSACPEEYAHLLKKKDLVNVGPIVRYLLGSADPAVYLCGDAVRNLYVHGRKRKYKTLALLAVLTVAGLDKCSCIMNNIISSNDGAFSMGFKYRVRKNRAEGCFKELAQARYVIETRLEGPEKLLYPFRPAAIELDITTRPRFARALEGNAI